MDDPASALSIDHPGGRRLCLAGDLDLAAAPELTRAVDALPGQGDLWLHVGRLTFIDSSGIRVLLRAARALDGTGRVILEEPTDSLRRVLALLGLDTETDRIVLAAAPSNGECP